VQPFRITRDHGDSADILQFKCRLSLNP